MMGPKKSCSSNHDDEGSSNLDAELTRARQELALLHNQASVDRHA
jgi:hypothetical protein